MTHRDGCLRLVDISHTEYGHRVLYNFSLVEDYIMLHTLLNCIPNIPEYSVQYRILLLKSGVGSPASNRGTSGGAGLGLLILSLGN